MNADLHYENVAGNAYDKYHTANPIARLLMQGFLDSFDALADKAPARTSFEIGCGEGYLSERLQRRGVDVRGCDLEPSMANMASALCGAQRFSARSIYDFAAAEIDVDLLVCCEVLEHLPDPERGLRILAEQKFEHAILSVPREPLWRAMNMARLKYVSNLGNTPGHINHWSSGGFRRFVSQRFDIMEARRPLPWTMLLVKPKR